ncbi:MAG: glycosyltransferase family 2 protein, partial [Mycetocola sp.]
MSPRVTAIVVVHSGFGRDGSDHLSSTLTALGEQSRRPDRLVVVATGTPDTVLDTARAFAPTQLVTAPDSLPFGAAIALAMRSLPDVAADELLWFLAQDSVPRPDALRTLVGALETAPSVAIAAPKVLDGNDPSMIASFGQSITRFGARVDLVTDEMDQGQHDDSSDVLGAQATAMLVRASVFSEIGGFDPALVSFDGGIDLSIRARLAGHRVAVAPAAAVLDHGDGVAGPRRDTRASTRRRNTRLSRFSQLHRRLVYSPGWALWLHWLALVPTAIVRIIVALIRKRPETITAELGSALQAAFSRQRLGEARRKLARAKITPWSSLAPLRTSWAEVRRRRRLRAEDNVPVVASERSALRFFDGGGAWVVMLSALIGVLLVVPLLGGGYLAGLNLTQLSGSLDDLWRNAGFGWRDISVGQAGAADPFALVLAVLGSLTFWQPSAAIVAIMVAALPLATLGGWFAMVR